MGEVCLKKILVLDKSKTGFSERYARWIAEDLQCDLANLAEFKKDSLLQYGLIIYGAGVYAGQINGIGKIKRDLFRQMAGDDALSRMRNLKRLFDPDWILNPGTLLETP